MKLLNLTADWLDALLPHALSRVDRVHYGLLQPAELARAYARNPTMPRNRALLAVPFAGKDVPTVASEYAHPDVAIGLTTLAFRYEGLRRHDLVQCVRRLREEMGEQTGPLRQRPACLTWVAWVEAAGARVRGTARAPVAVPAVRQLESAVTVQRFTRGQQVRRRVEARLAQLRRTRQQLRAALGPVAAATARSLSLWCASACGDVPDGPEPIGGALPES